MPIKLFNDGEILTADSVNEYFMDQSLIVFEDATERNTAFNATPGLDPTKPDLQEGRICYLKSDDKIYIYTGSAWTPQLALIEAGVVTTENLDGTVGSEAVTTAKMRTGAVTETKIGTGAVTETKIGTGAVTVNKIGTGAVTSDKIDNLTIVDGDISNTANIALTKLASGALPSGITIASANITNLTLKTEDIENGAITSEKLGTDLSLSGSTKIEEIFESATIVAAQPVASNGATLTLTITSGAVYYYTVATSHNIVLDIITTGLAVGQAATVLLMVTSGATTGKLTSITVNSTANTPKWFGGNAYPNGSGGNAVDAYTITVFRSSTIYTVFASQSKFA